MVENSFGLMKISYDMVPSTNKFMISNESFEKTPYEFKMNMIKNLSNSEWQLRKRVFYQLMNFLMINDELHSKTYPPYVQILNDENVIVGQVSNGLTIEEYNHSIELAFGVKPESGWKQPLWNFPIEMNKYHLYAKDGKHVCIHRDAIVLEDLVDGLIELRNSIPSSIMNSMKELTTFECFGINYDTKEIYIRCKFSI
jgi:hypothetical protein